jgi:hypothetical protein
MQIKIISPNAITYLPWTDDRPDFTGITEPSLSVLKKAFQDGDYTLLPQTEAATAYPPDWQGFGYTILKNKNDILVFFKVFSRVLFSLSVFFGFC